MARRTAKQKQMMQKRTARALLLLLGAVLLGALLLTVPGLEERLNRRLGIAPVAVVPLTGSEGPVGVHFIDVGQGDAVLLEENGEFALMDAGPGTGQEQLLAYLHAAGVQRLRYVFMTHPHEDHIGGMQAVVEMFPVDAIILPDLDKAPYPTTPVFTSLLECLLEYGIPAQQAAAGNVYPLGGGSVQVLQAGVEAKDNYNLLSLALLFESGSLRFLNTGDAEKANERALLESGTSFSANLYMAAHHGSSTSNTANFINEVRPALVVISCAQGNRYGHPHLDPLAAFSAVGARVLRTDEHGSVVVRPDGAGGLAYGCEHMPDG